VISGATGLPLVWGATPDERHRAVPVAAPPAITWRWLCQLAVAPYSYDWIDNRGRRSPAELTPGAEHLEVGQTMVVIFRITSLEDGHHWTGITDTRGEQLFGPIGVTYAAEPDDAAGEHSRIVCRMSARRGARTYALAWGDLVMMRKQLLTLKQLAERDARRGTSR
jgi:hypothetical protein